MDRIRVLVVEDHDEVRRVLGDILSERGSVDLAANEAEAMPFIQAGMVYDLAVVDCNIGDRQFGLDSQSGRVVLALKKLNLVTKVIRISASRTALGALPMQVRGDAQIRKPMTADELLDVVERLIPQ